MKPRRWWSGPVLQGWKLAVQRGYRGSFVGWDPNWLTDGSQIGQPISDFFVSEHLGLSLKFIRDHDRSDGLRQVQ